MVGRREILAGGRERVAEASTTAAATPAPSKPSVPTPKPAAPPPDAHLPDWRLEARTLLKAFWGASNGGLVAFNAMSEGLEALKLSPPQLRTLRRGLPVTSGPGTTSQRIETASRLLDDMAEK